MEYNFESLPRYQRMQQKMASYSPDQMAIVDSLIADKKFASEQMRTELAGMRLARQRATGEQAVKRGKHSLKMGEHALRMGDYRFGRLKMREDVQDWEKKQNRIGEYLGWANVIGATGLGLAKSSVLSKLAKREAGLRRKHYGS